MGRLVPYLLILTLVGLRVASGPTTLMAYVALGAYALTGRGAAIRAVALSWFLTMINPGLAAASGGLTRKSPRGPVCPEGGRLTLAEFAPPGQRLRNGRFNYFDAVLG
ncbi:hypothetical protein KHC23_23335 [Ancylobacter dichloromethanicus]|uniref:Uncharacterized protein n=1 Tax=Ancylobacter dichloromethanicus TaxID=518825 RepID=A0A9W6J8W2_9HYPH|nr:hypothetical protein [Ancylobacter dichloromethanicus]MBS7556565.1 hypothetical protein [Ancylobacter dichloromethanicus]GLK72517.1 hypothetical protein GCM10017643_26330 [Ancylobacter dichloromethanicus]